MLTLLSQFNKLIRFRCFRFLFVTKVLKIRLFKGKYYTCEYLIIDASKPLQKNVISFKSLYLKK